MKISTNLKERRTEKQKKYTLSVLRDIHLADIRQSIRKELFHKMKPHMYDYEALERMMIDYTIEIYLYGASFGRWGYYGENFTQIKQRMKGKERFMAEELYTMICEKINVPDVFNHRNIPYIHTQYFVDSWLKRGFVNGMKKYKLKIIT